MPQFDEAAIRSQLETERKRLENDIYARTEGDEAVVPVDPIIDSGGVASHEADDADALSDFERNQAMIAHSREQLDEVTNALQRLDAGTYGICARCGKEIAPRRLEALPWVTLCISCAEEVEPSVGERLV